MASTSRSLFAFLLLAVILAIVPRSTTLADALLFRGDPAHSGVYLSLKVPALDHVKWKFKTGGENLSASGPD